MTGEHRSTLRARFDDLTEWDLAFQEARRATEIAAKSIKERDAAVARLRQLTQEVVEHEAVAA